jgi:hypothetical protein
MRLGRFTVHRRVVEGHHAIDLAKVLAALKFIPTYVTQDLVVTDPLHYPESYLYIGISPKFELVPEGGSIPRYIIRAHGDGRVEVKRI